jgi:hypothetical protein
VKVLERFDCGALNVNGVGYLRSIYVMDSGDRHVVDVDRRIVEKNGISRLRYEHRLFVKRRWNPIKTDLRPDRPQRLKGQFRDPCDY